MYLEILSPELTLYSGEVDTIAVPGVNGEFEMLKNHAPIVSLLKEGVIKLSGVIELGDDVQDKFTKNQGFTSLKINSGTIEMKDNKVMVLVD